MAKRNYGLALGGTIFYDDETQLKVVAGETVNLDKDNVGEKTRRAIMSGCLIEVKDDKKSSTDTSKTEK